MFHEFYIPRKHMLISGIYSRSNLRVSRAESRLTDYRSSYIIPVPCHLAFLFLLRFVRPIEKRCAVKTMIVIILKLSSLSRFKTLLRWFDLTELKLTDDHKTKGCMIHRLDTLYSIMFFEMLFFSEFSGKCKNRRDGRTGEGKPDWVYINRVIIFSDYEL